MLRYIVPAALVVIAFGVGYFLPRDAETSLVSQERVVTIPPPPKPKPKPELIGVFAKKDSVLNHIFDAIYPFPVDTRMPGNPFPNEVPKPWNFDFIISGKIINHGVDGSIVVRAEVPQSEKGYLIKTEYFYIASGEIKEFTLSFQNSPYVPLDKCHVSVAPMDN